MAEIKAVTDATFEETVLKNERPVVVDFWAVWCGPCKMVAPEMEKLAAKYDGQVDVVHGSDVAVGLEQAASLDDRRHASTARRAASAAFGGSEPTSV